MRCAVAFLLLANAGALQRQNTLQSGAALRGHRKKSAQRRALELRGGGALASVPHDAKALALAYVVLGGAARRRGGTRDAPEASSAQASTALCRSSSRAAAWRGPRRAS